MANAKSDNMFPACFGRRDQTQLPSNSKRDWICLPLCCRLQQICHASSQPFTYTLTSIPSWYLLRDFGYKQGRNFPFVPDWLIHSKVKVQVIGDWRSPTSFSIYDSNFIRFNALKFFCTLCCRSLSNSIVLHRHIILRQG